ncbi:hypothethical protein (plasmid) [Ralstonia solanacearum CMR15]|nr:hypothethical protein [Ralstonia solanacearum CMR15]
MEQVNRTLIIQNWNIPIQPSNCTTSKTTPNCLSYTAVRHKTNDFCRDFVIYPLRVKDLNKIAPPLR